MPRALRLTHLILAAALLTGAAGGFAAAGVDGLALVLAIVAAAAALTVLRQLVNRERR